MRPPAALAEELGDLGSIETPVRHVSAALRTPRTPGSEGVSRPSPRTKGWVARRRSSAPRGIEHGIHVLRPELVEHPLEQGPVHRAHELAVVSGQMVEGTVAEKQLLVVIRIPVRLVAAGCQQAFEVASSVPGTRRRRAGDQHRATSSTTSPPGATDSTREASSSATSS